MRKNCLLAPFLVLVCVFASVVPASAALVTVTINFGLSGSATASAGTINGGAGTNFAIGAGTFSSNGAISDLYQGDWANITLAVGPASCAGSTGDCRLAGSSDGVPATVTSAGIGAHRTTNDDPTNQLDEGDALSVVFTGAQSASVVITSLVLVNVDDSGTAGDGAIFQHGGSLLHDDRLANTPLTGDSYDATNGIYRTGAQSWAGTSFTLAAFFGPDDVNDFYMQSLSFSFEDSPEPVTYALFAGGLLVLAAGRKLRSRRS